jgi:putative transposase
MVSEQSLLCRKIAAFPITGEKSPLHKQSRPSLQGTAHLSPAFIQRWVVCKKSPESRRDAIGTLPCTVGHRGNERKPDNLLPCLTPRLGSRAFRLQHQTARCLIPDADELCRYITGVAKAKNISLLAAGGTANHIHLLIAAPPTIPLAKAVQELKGNSSRRLRERGVRFAWQEGYGAFSVSQSQKRIVADYISRQAEHHRKWSFEQEFMTLLRKSGVAYDTRYVFG